MPTDPDRLDLDGVRHAYDTVAESYAEWIPDTRAETALDLAMVDAFVETVTSGTEGEPTVLDAGCGAGRLSRYLADRGCRVRGIDLSPGMVAMARRDHPDLTFGVGSLTALPIADGLFDGVLVWYSTIHLPPTTLESAFAEVARVLRPGGHVLVGFQAGEGTRDVSAAYRRHGHEVTLERHLVTPDRVARAMAGAGLKEVSRLVRRPSGAERDDQAFLLARQG